MAKTKWNNTDVVLTCTLPESGLTANFDMTLLYPDFNNLPAVVQTALMYGIKQKLADSIAKGADVKLNDEEAKDVMTARYEDICAGNWNVVGTARSSIKKDADEFGFGDEMAALIIKIAEAKKAKEKLEMK